MKKIFNSILTLFLSFLILSCSTKIVRKNRKQQKDTLYYEFLNMKWKDNHSADFVWLRSQRIRPNKSYLNYKNINLKNSYRNQKKGFVFLKIPAGKMEGAEISSAKRNYHYGRYQARLKPSSVPGCVNAFFFIKTVKPSQKINEEIDIEFLTSDFSPGKGRVHLVIHSEKRIKGYQHYRIIDLDFNPSDDFHTYGIVWTKDKLDFTIDNRIVTSFKASEGAYIPREPTGIFFNAWTGDAQWGGGPPEKDATMIIDRLKYKAL